LSRLLHAPSLLGVATALAGAIALGASGFDSPGYTSPAALVSSDTSRLRADSSRVKGSNLTTRTSRHFKAAAVPGYLSSWGLPPVLGEFTITDTGLVFLGARGSAPTRASTISLAFVDNDNGRVHYLFRVDAGVFETDAPGPLLDVAAHRVRLNSPRPIGSAVNPALVNAADSMASLRTIRQVAGSPYADSLYSVFGHPRAGIGLIGRRGRMAGRLGEYIGARDSLALDPVRMTGEAQLRHALAHELGHRWQARAKAQISTLWSGVPSIRDPKRYGYGELSEHQAEAIAFAISFLQTTAATREAPASSLNLLDHYELLVPGTRTMVRYLSLQPIYQNHPLRLLLTTGRITRALEK
jgi:hypothetical protein